MKEYKVIGIMSGTSLDGVDLAYCCFSKDDAGWKFEIRKAVTKTYSMEWKEKLSTLHLRDAFTLAKTNSGFGHLHGEMVNEFISENNFVVDFISSHGHTIFHQPHHGLTFQLGDGAALSAGCRLPVVCDFRSKDVALGGQGAPLVPIGDHILFAEYDFCLNLGGIANISFVLEKQRIAFDVSPCNLVLNHLASLLGKDYDEDGMLGQRGSVINTLLNELNACDYYRKGYPKSLGREDVEQDFVSIIDASGGRVEDKLRTFCEHLAIQVENVVAQYKSHPSKASKLLVTGGGAFNHLLMKRMKELSTAEIVIPEEKIIQFKEALIFAFLGVLRWREEVNCLKSVTGASRDHIGGAVYLD